LSESGIKLATAGVEKRIELLEKLIDDLLNMFAEMECRVTELETLEGSKIDLLTSIDLERLEPSPSSKEAVMSEIKKLLREYYVQGDAEPATRPKVELDHRIESLEELNGQLETVKSQAEELVTLEEHKKKLKTLITSKLPSCVLPELTAGDRVMADYKGDGVRSPEDGPKFASYPGTLMRFLDDGRFEVKLTKTDWSDGPTVTVSTIRDCRRSLDKSNRQIHFEELLCKYDKESAAVTFLVRRIEILRKLNEILQTLLDDEDLQIFLDHVEDQKGVAALYNMFDDA